MKSLQLVKAEIKDVSIIRHIAMATWPVTYGSILSSGQLEYMLSTIYNANVIEKQITTGEQQYLLAYQNELPIAFAAFGEAKKNPLTYKLHKIYVLPTIQKSGAGKALLEEVEKLSKKAGAEQLILNVNRHNNAKDFYQRMDFSIIETVDINIGKNFYMNDYVMGKRL